MTTTETAYQKQQRKDKEAMQIVSDILDRNQIVGKTELHKLVAFQKQQVRAVGIWLKKNEMYRACENAYNAREAGKAIAKAIAWHTEN